MRRKRTSSGEGLCGVYAQKGTCYVQSYTVPCRTTDAITLHVCYRRGKGANDNHPPAGGPSR